MASPSSGALALTFPFESHSVRVTVRDEQPWFIASDVCAALSIGNSRMALDRLDDDEKGVSSTDTPGGAQDVAVVNESGLYSLILGSRKPAAKRFKRWVTSEVLPSIRKTGGYSVPTAAPTPALVADTFDRVVAERDALRAMLVERVLKDEPVLAKALYYYTVPGLTHAERARLMGWASSSRYFEILKRLATLGLIDYQPDARLSANGKRNIEKLRQRLAQGPIEAPPPLPKGHPARKKRPQDGGNADHMARMRAKRWPSAKGDQQ